jgi:hypothetical protein
MAPRSRGHRLHSVFTIPATLKNCLSNRGVTTDVRWSAYYLLRVRV